MGVLITQESVKTVIDVDILSSLLGYLRDVLNSSSILPVDIGVSNLDSEKESACIVVDGTPIKTVSYVDGGYEGSLSVQLIYRTLDTNTSSDKLAVLATLNKFNDYLLNLDTSLFVSCEIVSLLQSSLSTLVAQYKNGVRDFSINITLTYCVG